MNMILLRQKAEEELKKLKSHSNNIHSESAVLKLMHELQVHQIELEMQNAELILANEHEKRAKEKYTKLYDFAPSGFLTLSKEGDIVELNISAAEILGKERPALLNACFAFFISENTRPVFNRFFENIFKSNTKETCEIIVATKENALKNIIIEGILSENGEQCLLNFVDITERKQAKEALIKANKNLDIQFEENEILYALNTTKDKFFSILSHDLKNNLYAIMGLSDLLMKNSTTYDREKNVKFASTINSATQNTCKLLDNLLDWARVQTGHLKPNPTKIRPSALIHEVELVSAQMSKSKNINLQSEIYCDDFIFADQEMLKTVLRNLITNALKYTNSGGTVTIETQKTEKNVLFMVSDTGIGIELEYINKLFRIDSKLSNKGTANEKGTGLGLILCKEFVEKNGGEIWVESEFRKGSSFKFTVPLSID